MLKVLVVGLGPIGLNCARAVNADAQMELVGLVDTDPAKLGRTLDELADRQERAKPREDRDHEGEPDRDRGPRVVGAVDEAVVAAGDSGGTSGGGGADVAIVTTTSRFDRVAPTLRELIGHRMSVVTSCEEMAWPWYGHRELAEPIDQEAKRAGCALLGTGVNPGFVMDILAVMMASVVRRVTSVRCVRRVDAALRRPTLQAKVGATMKPDDFRALAKTGKLGHMGLAESVALLAAGLGQQAAPGSVEVGLEPVVAEQPVRSALGLVEPGRVAGLHNTARWVGHGLTIEMDLWMVLGLYDPKDAIEINGPVPIRVKIPGGLPGDSATVAILVNHARRIRDAAPGLRTMLDLPPVGCMGQD